MKRILVVDDEPQIKRMLRTSLQSSGYEVILAANGIEGLAEFESKRPDLIISDLAMPEMNGLELTQAIRRIADTPIIVLSVRDTDAMKISALDEGADDYLTKPFSMPELLARVRAQLRRTTEPEVATRISIGDFIIDADAHTATVRGAAIHLTPKEFDLLLLFARSPGRVLTHKVLLRSIWGPAGEDQPEYLRVLIAGLRKKIERPDAQKHIESEPWVGYRFQPGAETQE
ncbi:MAG: response regulator transcription factor [Edaphobacter sp.]|uniref:response regulator transcription factor n=1 Tax=Edaphobacter sp. TaxID=1934404 RepID=UPI0023869018|nr:response regulator transcription factor [Edaphobacter sp.]MDE1177143.1 response regulator transcription factor [Edaphobacter sp.]